MSQTEYRGHRGMGRGRWRIERERCAIEADAPITSSQDAKLIGPTVRGIVKKLGLDDRQWLNDVLDAWPSTVGETVARHSRPGRYENGALVVFVDSAIWLHELRRFADAEILSNLKRKFGPDRIRSVTLALDPDR